MFTEQSVFLANNSPLINNRYIQTSPQISGFHVKVKMAEKTSVSLSELEKKRDEILQMENGAEWKIAKRFEHTVFYRRSDNDSVYKCVSHLVGMPKEDCVKLFTDFPIRKRYDTQFSEIKVLEDTGECVVAYWYCPFPFPCSDRDLVNCSKVFNDEATNTSIYVAISAVHPDAPERPKVVRAETILAGTIFRPDEKDPNSSTFTSISHFDMKGLLPTFVVNSAVIGNADKTRAEMTKFYNEVYVKEKNEKE